MSGRLVALALTAFFLVVVCTPIQAALSRLRSNWTSYLGGFLAGPFAVILYFVFKTHFDGSFDTHVVRQAWMHLIFGLLGLWFSINYRRRFGPDNSFKPNRLRGPA